MKFLELRELAKRFGEATAVSTFSLSISKGEFICLLGPSGCGKTTTLQMIAGFVQPSAGKIFLDGRDITAVKPCRRGLGIVFQSYALFPHMTVAQNVAFGLEMRKVPAAERCERVGKALEMVHLSGHADRYPRDLSGGQRQRVALARALVIQPPILLLDEPMGALDAKLREDMQIELRALQHQLGITTIMVTHDQAEALTLADRVVLMNKGHIEQIGRPFEMYEQPNGTFSSTFLGKANLFPGAVAEGDFRIGAYRFPVAPGAPEGAADYVIRPEKIQIASSGGLIRGRVIARAFLGNYWLFNLETPLGPIQVTQANAGLPEATEGDDVGVIWQAEHARVLSREAQ